MNSASRVLIRHAGKADPLVKSLPKSVSVSRNVPNFRCQKGLTCFVSGLAPVQREMYGLQLGVLLVLLVTRTPADDCLCQGALCQYLVDTRSCESVDAQYGCDCSSCADCFCDRSALDFPDVDLCRNCGPGRRRLSSLTDATNTSRMLAGPVAAVGWFLASTIAAYFIEESLEEVLFDDDGENSIFYIQGTGAVTCETPPRLDFCGDVIYHQTFQERSARADLLDAQAQTLYDRLSDDDNMRLVLEYGSCARALKESICYGQFPECNCVVTKSFCMSACNTINDCYADFVTDDAVVNDRLCDNCDSVCEAACDTAAAESGNSTSSSDGDGGKTIDVKDLPLWSLILLILGSPTLVCLAIFIAVMWLMEMRHKEDSKPTLASVTP